VVGTTQFLHTSLLHLAEIGLKASGVPVAVGVGVLLDDDRINDLTGKILGAAIEVHRVLGPGLLESIYSSCLRFELADRRMRFVVQQQIPIMYKTARLPGAYFVDLIVEDVVVVEVKCVAAVAAVHKAQVLTYLRLTEKPAGLLINFNVARLMDGVSRLINPRMR
jgi:GxxExxY protein